MVERLLICGAVEGELAGLFNLLENGRPETVGRRRTFTGRLSGIRTRLLLTGPGVLNTVQALTAVIEKRRPGMILMVGCAGGFDRSGLAVGDIGIATEEIDAHLGIEGETADALPGPLPFPVLTASGTEIYGRYPLHWRTKEAKRCLNRWFQKDAIRVKAGPFITVSTVTSSDQRAHRLFDAFAPVMENMEGAGAAHVAALYDIPFLEIRCAGNRVGNRDRAAWDLSTAFERCAGSVLALTDLFQDPPAPCRQHR